VHAGPLDDCARDTSLRELGRLAKDFLLRDPEASRAILAIRALLHRSPLRPDAPDSAAVSARGEAMIEEILQAARAGQVTARPRKTRRS